MRAGSEDDWRALEQLLALCCLLPLPAPTLTLLSPFQLAHREHQQHWGIFPAPSRAAEQHVVLETAVFTLAAPHQRSLDPCVDIRPVFDPGEPFPLKKDP